MFYVNFINLCAKNNVSQAEVARKIGISGAAMSKWKTGGMPSNITLAKLADYFGVSTNNLLGEETEQEKTSSSLDKELEGVEFALFGEVKELTDEEKEDILEYIRFKKSQRK